MEEERFCIEFEDLDDLFIKAAKVMSFIAENNISPFSNDFRKEKLTKKLVKELSGIDRDNRQ